MLFTLLIFGLNSIASAINCFTIQNIQNKGYVSYLNKVYDVKNYNHPGGQDTLQLSIGKPLEDFFNMPQYQFHINSQIVLRDLEKLYIGDLYNNCNNQTIQPIIKINIIENAPVMYSIITSSIFLFLFISTLIINNTKYKFYFGRIINIFYLKYINIGNILFSIIYFLWWLSLFILSFFSTEVIERLGIWISLNIAFTLLPMTRNSLWVTILKVQYNNLIFIHKFVAILSFLSVLVKIIVVIINYNFFYLFNKFNNIMGTISSISIFLTIIFSIPIIKKRIFELFYYSHRILTIITITTMSLHYISSLYYIAPSIFLYLIDIILRLFYIKRAIYSRIKNYEISETNTTYIFVTLKLVKKLNIKPGSYFFIYCKDISSLQWHPISLLSKNNNTLLFCIKDMGLHSWSNSLKVFKNNSIIDNEAEIYLQGPYSHFKLNYNYKYIFAVANGIGITPFISILENINTLYKQKQLQHINEVTFVWIVPNEKFIIPFIELLTFDKELIKIVLFITQSDQKNLLEYYNHKYFKIIYSKPIIYDYIEKYMFANDIINKDIYILSCGSESLLIDINKFCSKFKIDLYNENF